MIEIRTNGLFDVFSNGVPVVFPGQRAKALFALLVYLQGGILSNHEGIWLLEGIENPSEKDFATYRKATHMMMTALREHGIGDIVVKQGHSKYLDFNRLSLDVPSSELQHSPAFKHFKWYERMQ